MSFKLDHLLPFPSFRYYRINQASEFKRMRAWQNHKTRVGKFHGVEIDERKFWIVCLAENFKGCLRIRCRLSSGLSLYNPQTVLGV
jgi:hypothetical protein